MYFRTGDRDPSPLHRIDVGDNAPAIEAKKFRCFVHVLEFRSFPDEMKMGIEEALAAPQNTARSSAISRFTMLPPPYDIGKRSSRSSMRRSLFKSRNAANLLTDDEHLHVVGAFVGIDRFHIGEMSGYVMT